MKKYFFLMIAAMFSCNAAAIELTDLAMEQACQATVVKSLVLNKGWDNSLDYDSRYILDTDYDYQSSSEFLSDAGDAFKEDILLGDRSLGSFLDEWAGNAYDWLTSGPSADDIYLTWNPSFSYFDPAYTPGAVVVYKYERDSLPEASYHRLVNSSDLTVTSTANDIFTCELDLTDILDWKKIGKCLADYFDIDIPFVSDNTVDYHWSMSSLHSRQRMSLMSTGEDNTVGFDPSNLRGGTMLVSAARSADLNDAIYVACDAAAVYTQSRPEILSANYQVNSPGSLTVSVNARYDISFSKNAVNDQGLTYIYKFLHQDPGFSRIVTSTNSTITYSGLVGPEYFVKVEVFDGTFKASQGLGVHVVNPDVTCSGMFCEHNGF